MKNSVVARRTSWTPLPSQFTRHRAVGADLEDDRLHRLGVLAVVAVRAPSLADDRHPGLFFASATMSTSVCALWTMSGLRTLSLGGLARIRHPPAVHLLVDQPQERVEGLPRGGDAVERGALVRAEAADGVGEAHRDLLEVLGRIPVVDVGPVAAAALEAEPVEAAAGLDLRGGLGRAGHRHDRHPPVGGQLGDALAEALHLLDVGRVGAGGDHHPDHRGVGDRRRRGAPCR